MSLKDALNVPVTTALESCVESFKSLSAPRVLLLTPFVEIMNKRHTHTERTLPRQKYIHQERKRQLTTTNIRTERTNNEVKTDVHNERKHKYVQKAN